MNIVNYIEPLYRPPSEARSLILQITNGCSYNQCTFCSMYRAPQKKFSAKSEQDVSAEIVSVSRRIPSVDRVFLADGDAMALSIRRLLHVLGCIRTHLSSVRRVSAYCLPRNLKNKTVDQLVQLRDAGLQLVYVGVESGDDEVLEKVCKGETYQSTLEALNKLKAAGISVSVMVLNGLGGRLLSTQHAVNSARLVSAAQPQYLSTLVLSLPQGEARFQQGFAGAYQPLNQLELFAEMELFVDNLHLDKTIFRSDHASNYLVLKGVLGRDKARLLAQVRSAIADPNATGLRPEWARGF